MAAETDNYESLGGGCVIITGKQSKAEFKDNFEIGRFLADLGYRVELLGVDNTPGVKNPDALVNDKKFEFKKPTTKSAIDRALRTAKNQANHIFLAVTDAISPEDLADAVSNRMRRVQLVEEL